MDTDIQNVTQTAMNNGGVPDYSVSAQILRTSLGKNTPWINAKWPIYLGYYKQIPELKKAVDFHAMYTVGKGWSADPTTTVILQMFEGNGKDTFTTIMRNLLIMKKINGDAYAEIVRDPSLPKEDPRSLLDLKPLNPLTIRTYFDEKGILDHYEEWTLPGGDKNESTKVNEFQPEDIFHLENDRLGNEIHGISVCDACEWVILARNQAMEDWKRVLHRSSIRVMYIDQDNISKLSIYKEQYKEAVANGELLILPALPKDATFQDLTAPPIAQFLEWIQYLEDFFYQAVGIPKIILGGTQQFTEASSKTSYLTYEQPYKTEQRELEEAIKSQLGIDVDFDDAASLVSQEQSNEAANTGQTSFQPGEMSPEMMTGAQNG